MPTLRDFLPRRQPGRPLPLVHIRPDLLAAVQTIAAQENLPVAVVVNDLLSFALAERQEADAALAAWQSLTDREREIAALVCLRLTNADIAAQLVLSPNTVKTHVRHILAKLGLNSKEELRRELAHLDFGDWLDSRQTAAVPATSAASPPGATPTNHPASHQAG
jgi:DNA-binding CsgD family transcriptional regulator